MTNEILNSCSYNLNIIVNVEINIVAGGIECENLSEETCSFAVSSGGKRCVLEKRVKRTGEEAYTCRTSEIEADKLKDHIETEQCVKACGLDRKSLGISSDSLLESRFTHQLCSPQCYQSCPNVVDLYFNLAAGEGNQNKTFMLKGLALIREMVKKRLSLLENSFEKHTKAKSMVVCFYSPLSVAFKQVFKDAFRTTFHL